MARNSSQQKVVSHEAAEAAPRFERLTQIAFVLALGLVLARATMADFSRSRGEPILSEAPRAAGAATGMGLDLLCCLPALLVLARRVMDRGYVLRWSWAVAPMALLAGWGVLSVFWSADKFAALCAGFHLIAATGLLWAGVQLVRSWLRLRMVAAIVFGLLLAYFMHSLFFKLVDVPSTKNYFDEHRMEILKERGIDDPFAIKQFENKVMSGELMGFFTSANSMAAVVVVLLVISMGLGAQRILDDPKDAAGTLLLVIAVGLGGWMIFAAQSKTAAMTPVMAVGAVAAAWRWRKAMARRSKQVYWMGLGVAALGVMAVVGHGLFHGGLPGASLTFRWNYWVGAMRIFRGHPVLGVGLDNFGLHYLGVRLPVASEEVKDPHNFLVKYLTELGVVGLVFCVVWVGRLGWELTRPVTPAAVPPAKAGSPLPCAGPRVISMLAIIVGLGLAINVACSLDFNANSMYVINEILRRVGMFALLLIGASVAAIKSLKAPELDGRPAPVLLYAMLAGLAVFLIHNLIDFSMSEPGPLMLFAWMAGSALGVRQPSIAGQKKRTAAAVVSLAVCIVLWLVAGGFVWAPTATAADYANDAAQGLRTKRPNEAMRLFMVAHEHQPLNADYAFRAAQAVIAGSNVYNPMVLDLLGIAIKGNPLAVDYYLMRARYLPHSPDPALHREQIKKDFRRAVALNPNEVSLRVEFGDALASFKTPEDGAEAIKEYEEALKFNGLLKEDEPKRLRGERVEEIRKKIAEVGKLMGK